MRASWQIISLTWVAGLVLCPKLSAIRVEGRVVEDHTGRPLFLAGIRLYDASGRELAVRVADTDLHGVFRTPDIAAGSYEVEAYHQDYLPVRVRVDRSGDPLILRLPKLGTISGRITDPTGQPNQSVRLVVLAKAATGTTLQPFSGPHQPDRDGRYRIRGLPPGEYAVAAVLGPPNSPGRGLYFYPRNERPQFFRFSGGEEYRDINFRLSPPPQYELRGEVLSSGEKEPLVLLYSMERLSLPVAATRAGPDGSFVLEAIPPGEYFLLAARPISEFARRRGVLMPGATLANRLVEVFGNLKDISLGTSRGVPVTIRLVKTGQPGTGEPSCPDTIAVTLARIHPPGPIERHKVLVSYGEGTRLTNVTPARYRILADTGPGCFLMSGPYGDVRGGGGVETIDLVVAPAGAVTGQVEDKSASQVMLIPSPTIGETQPARIASVDPDGWFSFTSLRPGWYRIAAIGRGEGKNERWLRDLLRMTEVEAPSGASVEVKIGPAPLSYK